MAQVREVPLPTHHIEEEINRSLAMQSGFTVEQVEFLRSQFKRLGRNPMETDIELIAIENGFDENKVKNLHYLHIAQIRRLDGFCEQKKNY